MGRIASAFKRLRKVNEVALIPYAGVGYPSLEVSRQLVPVIARQGADLILLGAPVRDPLAGGSNVSRFDTQSSSAAVAGCLSVAAEARQANEIPLLLVTNYIPLLEYGPGKLADDCATSGIDGLLVPDLAEQEARDLSEACQDAGIDLIVAVDESGSDAEIETAAETATGFIYCSTTSDPENIITRIRRHTDLPVVIGPDYGTPESVAEAMQFADGVVVSSTIAAIVEGLPEDEIILDVAQLVRELKEATAKPSPSLHGI